VVIHTLQRENDFLEHTQLFSAVLARLIAQVNVAIVIHQADPLQKWVHHDVHVDAATTLGCTAIVGGVKLLVLELDIAIILPSLTKPYFYQGVQPQIRPPVNLDRLSLLWLSVRRLGRVVL